MSVEVYFAAQARGLLNRNLRHGCFCLSINWRVARSEKNWKRAGLPKVFKTMAKQLGIDNFSASELPGDCLGSQMPLEEELSVWRPRWATSKMSVRIYFPAQARGILNRHLWQGRVEPLRRCLLESFSPHRLGEYWTDTSVHVDVCTLNVCVYVYVAHCLIYKD